MRKTNEIDKNRFVNCLDGAENELSHLWKDYIYFIQLQERFLAAKMIMKGGEGIVKTKKIDIYYNIRVYKHIVYRKYPCNSLTNRLSDCNIEY